MNPDNQSAPPAHHEPVNEYEREPIPESAQLGMRSFVGQYAGEHTAGTELMIGPLFVAAGVSAFDVLMGLIVGNLLAVLSWTFLTAPIATRARLTLYYQLEKICGRKLVTLYNLANGVMFCFLAGSMVTVSATAVGVWFDFRMPELNDIYPNSAGWVLAVLAVGSLIAIVAAYGYKMVARFANIAAPWMVLVFLAFGVVAFKNFVVATGTEIHSLSDVWDLCDTTIWKGGEPLPGKIKFTFWHVTFFAWFANLAMHVGMADLSVFRFARKSWYGIASGAGMYVGHFMAWLSASMLFAFQLHESRLSPEQIEALMATGRFQLEFLQNASLTPDLIRQMMELNVIGGPPPPLPGPLAYNAAGIAGLLCVIVAGWTTANPTIYRAGLAFQAIVPRASRFKVTLITGGVATIAGLFPALAMKLLEFVALYGMLLMPMGAVILMDFWVLPRLGLQSYFAERSRSSFHWAAGLTWFIALAVCAGLVLWGGVQIYFVSLPGWFVAALLYVILSWWTQRRNPSLGGSNSNL